MTGAGFASCSQPIPSYTVMGNIPDSTFNGKTVYIFDRDKGQNIDSAVIENGAFTFTGQIDTAVLCLTQVGRKYYTTFMLENGTIQLNMETPNSASGTPLNETFSSYIQEEKRISELFQNKMKEIREQEQDKSKVQELTKTYYDNEYKPAYMAMLKDFIDKNQDNYIGAFALQNLSNFMNPEEMESIIAQSSAFIQSRNIIRKLSQRITNLKKTAVGQPFTDFTVETEDGKKVSLSDYVGKGNYVLVDFWASWCGPCRREIPNLVETYAKYKGKNFEIVGVSLDQDDAAWKDAIKKLNMTWPQMSDLKFWQSEGAQLYAVNSIPHTVLIDGEGTIIARGLHGEELQAKIAEVVK